MAENSRLPKSRTSGLIWLAILLGLGITARFAVAALGHNYDFDSYRIVADLMAQGKNVYAETTRYNYGPIWFLVIHGLDVLAQHDANTFRWLLVGLLCLVDAGICYILWEKLGCVAATFFFLNPVSIIITGFTNQFDNLAILIGLAAVLAMGDEFEKPVDRRKFSGLFLLGLSLMTKHLLFVFPLWLAIKQKGYFQKCVVIGVPVAIFLAGFIPYWRTGEQGIIHNVFEYHSQQNHYLYSVIVPFFLRDFLNSQIFWFLCLGLFALVWRRRNALDSLILYTAVLVAASPAISMQYLAIPLVFIATRVNVLTIAYTLMATVILMVQPDCLHLKIYLKPMFPDIPIYLLAAAVVWAAWPAQITAAAKHLWSRIHGADRGRTDRPPA
jgi:hypothetical protein